MRASDTSWWRRIIGESLWRKRAALKAVHLWLPVAAIAGVRSFDGGASFVGNAVRIFIAAACYVAVSILVNDLADRSADESAGKRRPITEASARTAWRLLIFLIWAGAVVLLVSDMPRAVVGAYAAAILVGLLYSLRPARFKARGFLGPLAYSLSTSLAYLLMPWVGLSGRWPVLLALAPAVLLDKWVQLHFHQVIDHDADRGCGTRTLAVALGLSRAGQTLLWAARAASLAMLSAAGWVVYGLPEGRGVVAALSCAGAVGVALYARHARRCPGRSSDLLRLVPSHYLALSYAVFRVLPLALLFLFGLRNPSAWILFALAALTVALESRHMLAYRYE